MSTESERGTSRSGFLKQAAGATVAVAGAGIGAGAIATSASAADKRTYTAGRFALDLDGVSCGMVVGVDGGDLNCDVVFDEPVGSDGVQRKHIAGVKYEDITIQAGSNMDKTFYNWIKNSFDGKVERKSGSIIAGDFDYKELSRRAISTAFVSSVTIPALDGASKDPAYLAVSITPTTVSDVPPSSGQPLAGARQKAWLPSNFVFVVGGLDTSRVASIDSFTWKCRVAADGSFVMDVSDIVLTLPRARMASWQQWYDNMKGGADDERDGELTIVGARDGAVLTFGLENLGLHRLSPVPNSSTRIKAEMYCERMRLLPTVNK
jgi:phage tail-like protein